MTRIIKTMGLCIVLLSSLSFLNQLHAQGKQITGTVISSENKQPAVGVTVSVKGTRFATTTDVQGHYKITVDNKTTALVFSSTSFISREVAIGDRSVIDMELAPYV